MQAGEEARRQSEGLVAAKAALDEVQYCKYNNKPQAAQRIGGVGELHICPRIEEGRKVNTSF